MTQKKTICDGKRSQNRPISKLISRSPEMKSEKHDSIKVGINGYGVIGRRVADAILIQSDMELVGIADISADLRVQMALNQGISLYASSEKSLTEMKQASVNVSGVIDDLLTKVDVVVDCTPKKMGSENIALYRKHNVKFILQGGEKHEVTGHSFVAETSYEKALGRESTRVVSCNTTSIVRTLSALKKAALLKSARGVLLRRATDPWKSDKKGIMNTLVPEERIPSHQGPDAQSVDPELDVITMAVMVPETLGHLHYWTVRLNRPSSKEEVLDLFKKSSRIALVKASNGLGSLNAIKELMLDLKRPHGNLYEVALWENLVEVQSDELFYAYMVDNQAIVIPETIDAIRALVGRMRNGKESIEMTNESLGIPVRFGVN